MFTELDIDIETAQSNIEDIYVKSLNILCSDSMYILQNNSKVLRYLTDKTLSKELDMLVKSSYMAIKRNRFELLQNIILGLKGQIHKLAALEIKYFDEYSSLLRSDIYRTFVPQNLKKRTFISPCLKEIFEIFDETVKLSPTNAAFSIKTAVEVDEKAFIDKVLFKGEFTQEFINQIYKRYHANFGMTIEEELQNKSYSYSKNNLIKNFFAKAI